MPLYDYACTKCGHTVEVRHGFNETNEEQCPACGASLRRVFNAAPVLFKGSGFYVTDSRRSSGATKPEQPKSEASPPSDTAKSEAAPAAPKADTSKAESKTSEPAA